MIYLRYHLAIIKQARWHLSTRWPEKPRHRHWWRCFHDALNEVYIEDGVIVV
jgi:hypothetical protein